MRNIIKTKTVKEYFGDRLEKAGTKQYNLDGIKVYTIEELIKIYDELFNDTGNTLDNTYA